jgi:8-oxo-dGTP pyrophosphatase MutT (NUDIX family)
MSLTDEQVDIVDEQNQVISTMSKLVAHRDGLLHRIVIAELKNSRGEYCFVRQAGDRQDPGQFVSPVGGHVAAGETVDAALIRESREEIGITPVKYRLVGQTIFNREVIGRKENHLFLVYEIESDESPVLNHESVEFRWFSVDEVRKAVETKDSQFGAAWHHIFRSQVAYQR